MSPRGTKSGRAWLGLETPRFALQSQPCDLIDTMSKTDTAGHARRESSKTRVKAYHLSIRIFCAIGNAANRGENYASKNSPNRLLHAFAHVGQPGETGLHSIISQTATKASVNPTQLVCKTARLSAAERYWKESSDSPTAHGRHHLLSSEALPTFPVRRENGSGQATFRPKRTKPRKPDAVASQPAICESALGDLRKLGEEEVSCRLQNASHGIAQKNLPGSKALAVSW